MPATLLRRFHCAMMVRVPLSGFLFQICTFLKTRNRLQAAAVIAMTDKESAAASAAAGGPVRGALAGREV